MEKVDLWFLMVYCITKTKLKVSKFVSYAYQKKEGLKY